MVSRGGGGRRIRNRSPAARPRGPSPMGRIRPDHFDIQSCEAAQNRAKSPGDRFREDRRRQRWEDDRGAHSGVRSRSRNREQERGRHRDRRSRSSGRRNRSPERVRFEPPAHLIEDDEFERRRRSLSRELRLRDRYHSPPDRPNRFSPPHFENEMEMPLRFSETEEPFGKPMDVWNSMQANGPMDSMPMNSFGPPQGMGLVQPQFEKQEIPQTPVLGQGFQGPSFASTPIVIKDPPKENEDEESPIIPEFNPETCKLNSHQWLKLIEQNAQQRGWKKDEKHYILTSRLAGFARQWYLTTGISYKSWGELRGAFLKAFPTEMDFHTLLQQMMDRTKQDNETMSTYFHHKVALLNACEIHGSKAVSCIIAGLPTPDMKRQAKAQHCDDPDTLYMYLRQLGAHLTAKPEPPKEKPKSGKSLCFICKDSGHMAAQCPGKRMGQPQNNKKDFNTVMHGSLARKPILTKNFVDVIIKGIPFRAYVDLTSDSTTIREENALTLKLPITKQYKIIRAFGGASISSVGICNVAIAIDKAMANVRMQVVPDHVQAIPVVVGQSFTEQPHIVVMKEGEGIRFYQRMDNGEINFDF